MDFCKCGSIIIKGECTNQHCPDKNQKSSEWVIDGRGMSFERPLSYKEAAAQAKMLNEKDKTKNR